MNKTSIQGLCEFGQSVWLDNISRAMIKTGQLKEMINLGLRGMTSNPTIFDKSISSSSDYDQQIVELCNQNKTTFAIYDELTVRDIQDAADIFKPVYEQSNGLDGYISLEVNPKLAYNTKGTIEEGKRLYKKVNRPNVMFKVPSTKEGFPAIEELTACGININVTLIFSVQQYIDAAGAYIRGIRRYIQDKGDASKVRSVASVFVSRIDTAVDKLLLEKIAVEKSHPTECQLQLLRGRSAVANSHLIYREYLDILSSDEFKKLQDKDAGVQRVLWGSTSTKDPIYRDIKYVTELTAKGTINTMPEQTFQAYLGHGQIDGELTSDVMQARTVLTELGYFSIKIDDICAKLLQEGVTAFERSFDSLLSTIDQKKKALCQV